MSVPIYFIRHGQTDWNAEMRFQGQQDIPLNELGRTQAGRNGRALRDLINAEDFDFVASPLSRTRETMEIVREAMGLDPLDYRMDERLKELSFGEWEGRTVSDLSVAETDLWAERTRDKWCFIPNGGESYQTLTERVRGWVDELDHPTVVVSHGGVNRSVQSIFFGMDTVDLAVSIIPQDKIMIVDGPQPRWV